ncbi:MAG TPA: hypothetical protein VGJ73_02150 [Verrucomicrobiae bacterium]
MLHLNQVVLVGFTSCMLLAVPAVKATPDIVGTVQLDTESGVYPGLGGGEFTAYTSQNFVENYYGGATYDGGFETFCLETGVDFTPGNTYNYSLGNITQPLSGGGVGSGLNLTAGAAWLYQEFATGGLGNYGYSYTFGTTRQQDDNLLQAALWELQGGQSYPGYPSGDNQFYQDAINALGASGATNSYTGSSIEVIQLWDGNGNAAQNQLVYTPVPDTAKTAGLLGISVLGIVLFRFRNRKAIQ